MNKSVKNILSSDNFYLFIFLAPALIGILIFILIPVICSFGLSFAKWDLLNPIKYVGIQNYYDLFHNPVFYKILLNTFVFAISTSIFGVIIPLLLAHILNQKIRGSEVFKTVYFLPFITPMVVIAIVWSWFFDPNIGVINNILHTHINWLGNSTFAMPVLIFISVWKLIGYNLIIFLSSLSAISNSFFEAAKIDGANSFQIFTRVTIPLLSSTIFFVLIITTISSFQVFDMIYLMTQGGPFNSTNVLVYSIYQNAFEYFNIGKSCAIAYVLFFIIFILTLVQWKLRKKMVYNEID